MSKFGKISGWLQNITSPYKEFREKRKQAKSFEGVKSQCKQLLEYLDKCDDYSTARVQRVLTTWIEIPFRYFTPPSGSPGGQDGAYCTPAFAMYCQALGAFLAQTNYVQLFTKISHALQGHTSGVPEDPQSFENFRLLCYGIVNYTELSKEICRKLVEFGAIDILIQALVGLENRFASRPSAQIPTERIASVRLQCMLILYNIRHGNVSTYREANAAEALHPYIQSQSLTVKMLATILLAYIGNEEDRELLRSRDCARFLVALLKQAAQSEHHSATLKDGDEMAFSVVYLLDGINDFAINDDNKIELYNRGVTVILTLILQSDFNDEEKQLATKLLWNLASVERVRNDAAIPELRPALCSLQSSENATIRDTSAYALRDTEDNPQRLLEERATNPPNYEEALLEQGCHAPPPSYEEIIAKRQSSAHFHRQNGYVMLSYQSNSQEQVRVIRDHLVRNGFNVWMDADKRGDLATMATVVDKSDIVLLCMTEKYKDSCSCRSEAAYAYNLKKRVIPLLVEDGYVPDGWLGFLVGTDMHYRFCTDDEVESNIPVLMRAIEESGEVAKY